MTVAQSERIYVHTSRSVEIYSVNALFNVVCTFGSVIDHFQMCSVRKHVPWPHRGSKEQEAHLSKEVRDVAGVRVEVDRARAGGWIRNEF